MGMSFFEFGADLEQLKLIRQGAERALIPWLPRALAPAVTIPKHASKRLYIKTNSSKVDALVKGMNAEKLLCDSFLLWRNIEDSSEFSRFRMKNHERLANLALAGLTIAPLFVKIDPNLNVILTASLTVYVGCYRSVKPTPPSETMSNEHAMRFPLVGSAMLLSLFFLFKFLSKDLVNAVLTCYFFVLGLLLFRQHCCQQLNDSCRNHGMIIPSYGISHISGNDIFLYTFVAQLWRLSLQNHRLSLRFPEPLLHLGIEMLSLGSFKTGAILLAGLFVYDIFWVFFTPVMVSVAKSFDAPIKLLFPTSDSARPFSMLGLGDIVIPGMDFNYKFQILELCFGIFSCLLAAENFVALALRFDVSRGKESQYFKSAFVGYTVGLVVTIIVMNWFQAAQPALLYIVPGVIGFLAAHCLWNGEVKPLLAFDESKTSSASEETDADSSKKAD
ncbi:Signal peptide peptidase 1 [Sesamum angolense]|uniref:Signal peptide peptidase 1 n=1 Tax=Sesamum angolense TaxID=2727404 RepID=A0AAE1XAL4_9LAMI|nr:Signal peptide peptidase 1 [Sesamum angolense]